MDDTLKGDKKMFLQIGDTFESVFRMTIHGFAELEISLEIFFKKHSLFLGVFENKF